MDARFRAPNVRGQGEKANQNDRLDADGLSERLRLGSLKPVWHGSPAAGTLKDLVRCYDNLVDDSTRVMLRLKAIDRGRAIGTSGKSVYRPSQRKAWLAKLKARKPGPPEFVNAVLRSLTRAAGPPPLPAVPVEAAAVRCSFPDWIAARWIARYGQPEAEALMLASNERPPTTMRVNLLRITREALAGRLRDEELASTRPTALAPEGLLIDRGAVGRWAAFAAGWCTIQDEASMLVARLLDPQPGELVADACAAPGTKATHLAELMRNRGRIVAMDPQAARLKLVPKSAARLGITIIEPRVGSAAALAGRWKGKCDRVLVDAPCSNLGVLRRNPEVKWRRTEEDLRRLQDKQRTILEAAASMVKPGGRLVYATCSLEPDENEAVVATLLAGHGPWRVDPPEGFPVAPDAAGYVRLFPHVHGTDGFTAIRLQKRP